MIGRSPCNSDRIVPGTRRDQFTSPGPKIFPQRAIAIGIPYDIAYDCEIKSAHDFETSYGLLARSGVDSTYGSDSHSPYALSLDAMTMRFTLSPYSLHASST